MRSPGSLAPLRALACAPNYSTRLLCATKADGGPPASTSTRAFLLLRWHPGVDAVRLRLSVARADQQKQQQGGLEHMEQVEQVEQAAQAQAQLQGQEEELGPSEDGGDFGAAEQQAASEPQQELQPQHQQEQALRPVEQEQEPQQDEWGDFDAAVDDLGGAEAASEMAEEAREPPSEEQQEQDEVQEQEQAPAEEWSNFGAVCGDMGVAEAAPEEEREQTHQQDEWGDFGDDSEAAHEERGGNGTDPAESLRPMKAPTVADVMDEPCASAEGLPESPAVADAAEAGAASAEWGAFEAEARVPNARGKCGPPTGSPDAESGDDAGDFGDFAGGDSGDWGAFEAESAPKAAAEAPGPAAEAPLADAESLPLAMQQADCSDQDSEFGAFGEAEAAQQRPVNGDGESGSDFGDFGEAMATQVMSEDGASPSEPTQQPSTRGDGDGSKCDDWGSDFGDDFGDFGEAQAAQSPPEQPAAPPSTATAAPTLDIYGGDRAQALVTLRALLSKAFGESERPPRTLAQLAESARPPRAFAWEASRARAALLEACGRDPSVSASTHQAQPAPPLPSTGPSAALMAVLAQLPDLGYMLC